MANSVLVIMPSPLTYSIAPFDSLWKKKLFQKLSYIFWKTYRNSYSEILF